MERSKLPEDLEIAGRYDNLLFLKGEPSAGQTAHGNQGSAVTTDLEDFSGLSMFGIPTAPN